MLEPNPGATPDSFNNVVILKSQDGIRHRIIFENKKEQQRRDDQQMQLPVLYYLFPGSLQSGPAFAAGHCPVAQGYIFLQVDLPLKVL
ncbi:hypothetical protein D3C80_1466790 [compost metagenome]